MAAILELFGNNNVFSWLNLIISFSVHFFTGRFHSKKAPPPVKFSLDDDLPEEECRHLLDHYTPPHMKRNKALQTLFVK